MAEPLDTLALVARATRGDTDAVRALVQRLYPVVRARVRLAQGRRADLARMETADLVQEVFVRLLDGNARQLGQWEPTRGASLEGYVGMVTEREVGNAGQRSNVRSRYEVKVATPVDVPALQPSPEAHVVARDAVQRLSAHLEAQLPPKGRVVLRCLYADGLDVDETARMLGVNRQVIYNWQHRIRLLAREFQQLATA